MQRRYQLLVHRPLIFQEGTEALEKELTQAIELLNRVTEIKQEKKQHKLTVGELHKILNENYERPI
ncbi:hypothetical protein FOF46_23430 [Aquimarina algiphila]|uniref:Uncharacterized protein n=1 Tax=Aquimarina algiphila TaxID=2047982 RepID=A0A554VDZ5_9FLAO|nr:hypothetical protein [Aquimarina algiphila]TSE05218.1 hypothetical protein FOF46_23430 [Aquimarina algiphila]